jgi:AmmeMemoRadiSam system protein B
MKPSELSAAKPVRLPAVAGTFYPDSAPRLERMVEDLLARPQAPVGPAPKALIAPHAGYIYSGPIAASAFVQLPRQGVVRRVVLLGPSHFVPFEGLALSPARAFATPLGTVPVDTTAVHLLQALPQVRMLEAAHSREHSLEVELPFLQRWLGDFTIVPLVVGHATDEEVGQVIERLWGGPETVFVISSDLSHYYDYETACALDRQTARAIEALRGQDIGEEQACGRIPIRGLLWVAARRGLKAKTLDLRNSGDTAGPRDRVVGYGAFAFTEP